MNLSNKPIIVGSVRIILRLEKRRNFIKDQHGIRNISLFVVCPVTFWPVAHRTVQLVNSRIDNRTTLLSSENFFDGVTSHIKQSEFNKLLLKILKSGSKLSLYLYVEQV